MAYFFLHLKYGVKPGNLHKYELNYGIANYDVLAFRNKRGHKNLS